MKPRDPDEDYRDDDLEDFFLINGGFAETSDDAGRKNPAGRRVGCGSLLVLGITLAFVLVLVIVL